MLEQIRLCHSSGTNNRARITRLHAAEDLRNFGLPIGDGEMNAMRHYAV